MKINKYNMIMSGAAVLLTSAAFTSCNDMNDWKTDAAYDRLFSPSSLAVTAGTTSATLSWSGSTGTEYYVVELSTDSLYGANEAVRASSIVAGADGSITRTSYTFDDLNSGTKYFVRVKGCSSTTSESHWNYLDKYSFTTDTENILNAVESSDKGQDFITISWEAGMAVTEVRYAEVLGSDENGAVLGDENVVTLTADEKAEGKLTISNLKPSTGYQISIYNNGHLRGSRTVTTTMELPAADYTITLAPGEQLTQSMLDAASDKKSVLINLTDGGTYKLVGVDAETGDDASIKVPSGMSVTFYAAEGSNATLSVVKELVLGGVHGYIRFENLTIEDGGSQYLFNQGADATVTEISFSNCELNNFKRSVLRFKDSKAVSVERFSMTDCTVNNQGSGSYAFVTLDAATYAVQTMEFTNVVFNGLLNSGFVVGKSSAVAAVNAMTFTNCTFYNVVASGKYLIDAGSTSNGPAITFSKCIFGKTVSTSSKGVRAKAATVSNSYQTSDCTFSSNAIKGTTSYEGTSDDLFTSPASGDFSIKDKSFAEGVGAQR
jgi:hypothetical protein